MTRDEVLSLFVDGESVAPDVLARALLEPGAREALYEMVALRAAIADDETIPTSRFYEAHSKTPRAATARTGRMTRRPLAYTAAAAAVVLVAIAVAAWRFSPPPPPAPPSAAKDVAPAPPVPERVLSFEPGVDWQ